MQDSHSNFINTFYFFKINSVYSSKANVNHTHNDNSGVIKLNCSYGDVWKFKKNGWVTVQWANIDITSLGLGSWVVLASTGWSNQLQTNRYYGNFCQNDLTDARFAIDSNGDLRVFKQSNDRNTRHYGYIVYPTAD